LFYSELMADPFDWSPPLVTGLSKAAGSHGDAWQQLAYRLKRIAVAESFLAPASALFTHLLGCQNVPIVEVVERIQGAWGSQVTSVLSDEIESLAAELAHSDGPTGQRWVSIGHTLAQGDYGSLIKLLLEQNKVVMQTRGGAAWVEEENGKLHVVMTEERGLLPDQEDLPSLWRFPYFLDSLHTVASALKEGTP
jgi:hypothetical protein